MCVLLMEYKMAVALENTVNISWRIKTGVTIVQQVHCYRHSKKNSMQRLHEIPIRPPMCARSSNMHIGFDVEATLVRQYTKGQKHTYTYIHSICSEGRKLLPILQHGWTHSEDILLNEISKGKRHLIPNMSHLHDKVVMETESMMVNREKKGKVGITV